MLALLLGLASGIPFFFIVWLMRNEFDFLQRLLIALLVICYGQILYWAGIKNPR